MHIVMSEQHTCASMNKCTDTLTMTHTHFYWRNSSVSEVHEGQYCRVAQCKSTPCRWGYTHAGRPNKHTHIHCSHSQMQTECERIREKGTRPSLLVQSLGEITNWHFFPCCSFTHFLGSFLSSLPFILSSIQVSIQQSSIITMAGPANWMGQEENGTKTHKQHCKILWGIKRGMMRE